MTITEREEKLLQMKESGEITWDEWAELWYAAQLDDLTYPDYENLQGGDE